MNGYKITNVTNLMGRRDRKYNSIVELKYVDNRMMKTVKLKAGEVIYLAIDSLPLSFNRLRLKKLIDITEIDPKSITKPKVNVGKEKPVKVATKKTTKKASTKKNSGDETDVEKKVVSKKKNDDKSED